MRVAATLRRGRGVEAPVATHLNLPEHYLEGVQLFNAGQYWHAHEAWEDAWKAEQDATHRLFYKGIIQTAAALVHWQRGNPRGLRLNWAKARPKLAQLPEIVLRLDIPGLIVAMDHFEAIQGVGRDPPRLELSGRDAPRPSSG